MPRYVDGFVIPIPKKKLATYRRLAKLGAKLWLEHGALDYRECVGEDFNTPCGKNFPTQLKTKPGETVLFSWITFKSRAHRDRVNAKVMQDPRMSAGIDPKSMPFDMRRMVYGGFEVMVEA